MEKSISSKVKSLKDVNSSRWSLQIFNDSWVCFVDGEPYLVESDEDYSLVINRLSCLLKRLPLCSE